MDIKINAHGRYIEIVNANGTLEECADTALSLWLSTEKAIQDSEEIGAGSNIVTEKSYSRTGFAYLPDGERLEIK